jgi:hypothetical protein
VTVAQLRAIFTRLLRRPAPTAARIADEVTRVLLRNEESRIYHWKAATGSFPPKRDPPEPSSPLKIANV